MAYYPTLYVAVIYLALVTLASTKPIMVTFGTNQGPIVPRQPKSSTLQPRTIVARSPAPVSEEREDIPNPTVYKPLVPHQYRNKIYSYKPQANLILGTPLDQKYTPSYQQKYDAYNRKQYSRSLGLEYTGPHIFDKQDYEFFQPKKTTLEQTFKYNKPHYYQVMEKRYDGQDYNGNNKYVPQIGVVYSAGVRYYVPQVFQQQQQQQIQPQQRQEEDENSVYDKNDEKYYNYRH